MFDVSFLVQVTTQFLKMETLLDDSVDMKIQLKIERGGTPFTVYLLVSFGPFGIDKFHSKFFNFT